MSAADCDIDANSKVFTDNPQSEVEVKLRQTKTLPLDNGMCTSAGYERDDTSTDMNDESGDYRGDPSLGGNPGIGNGHLSSLAPHPWTAADESPMSFQPASTNSFSIQGAPQNVDSIVL